LLATKCPIRKVASQINPLTCLSTYLNIDSQQRSAVKVSFLIRQLISNSGPSLKEPSLCIFPPLQLLRFPYTSTNTWKRQPAKTFVPLQLIVSINFDIKLIVYFLMKIIWKEGTILVLKLQKPLNRCLLDYVSFMMTLHYQAGWTMNDINVIVSINKIWLSLRIIATGWLFMR